MPLSPKMLAALELLDCLGERGALEKGRSIAPEAERINPGAAAVLEKLGLAESYPHAGTWRARITAAGRAELERHRMKENPEMFG